jgi:hypothetical protein
MLRIECKGCEASAYADCACPPLGHDPGAAGAHHPACPMADLGATVTCAPGSGCCDGSSHPGLSHDMAAHLGHPNMIAGSGEPDHEGDHTEGNPDCAVCRPVTIEVMPGSAYVTAAGG